MTSLPRMSRPTPWCYRYSKEGGLLCDLSLKANYLDQSTGYTYLMIGKGQIDQKGHIGANMD